jgi:hypothetical protein
VALIEAILSYKLGGIGAEGTVPLGKTNDPRVLRSLRDCLLEEAAEEARFWRNIDPGVSTVRIGELERLTTIFAALLPDEDLSPNLRPISGVPADGNPDGAE